MKPNWTAFWQRLPFKSIILLKLYEHLRFRSYKKLLKNIDFKNFLDIGGGSGYMAKLLAEQFNKKGTVIDNNREACKTYSKIGKSNKTFYLTKNIFDYCKKHDLVISDGLIEHFSKKERKKMLEKHEELTKKYVLIFVPKKTKLVNQLLKFKHGYEKYYTKDELLKEIKNAGLKPIKTTTDFHMHGILATIHSFKNNTP